MKRFLTKVWNYSYLITLPIGILFGFWLINVWESYYRFHVVQENHVVVSSLHQTGLNEFNRALLGFQAQWLTPVKNEGDGLKQINLFIPEASLAQLDAALPYSGREYVQAGIWNGKALEKVKVRYRGAHAYHWAHRKKSLRVKTKKSKLYDGMRRFNLLVPKVYEQINEYASYRLAEKMGLITPRTEMVELIVNGQPRGAYLLVEELGELTLRKKHLLPGDLYEGELIGKDKYIGASDNLFRSASLWGKIASNNHYPLNSKKPLERLVALLRDAKHKEAQEQLSKLMDMDSWGRFSAFETLAQTTHYDLRHNWRIYFDPARNVFLPIINDPNGYTADEVYPFSEMIRSDLHFALFQNGDFMRSRSAAMHNFFQRGLDQDFLHDIETMAKSMESAILRDPNIMVSQIETEHEHSAVTAPLGSYRDQYWPQFQFRTAHPREIVDALRMFPSKVKTVFSSIRNVYFDTGVDVSYRYIAEGGIVAMKVTGRKTVNKLTLKCLNEPPSQLPTHLRFWTEDGRQEVDITGAVEIKGSLIELTMPLHADYFVSLTHGDSRVVDQREFRSGYYELVFGGLQQDNEILTLFVDWGESQLTMANRNPELSRRTFESMKLVVNARPISQNIVWQNEVFINQTLEIDDDLVIRSGTVVRLGPNANLILSGHLFVQGTATNPVQFVPTTDSQEPWGAIVLKGKAANGSELNHAVFKGGSGYKGDLFEYSGMLSIHDVKDVQLSNCRFSDSNIVDDMVHIVYSEAHFKNCVFERSLMDALDIDISTAKVENCLFTDSGNDALDLMDSKVVVIDTVLENSGDKGISVGEGSRLFAVNSRLEGNAIGVQVKDGSVASLYNLDFVGNELALDAYKKNWRYNGGGDVFVHKSYFKDNSEELTADKKSTIHVSDSFFSRLPKLKKKRVKIDDFVDTHDERKAKINVVNHFPKEAAMSPEFKSEHLQKIDPTRRGAVNLGQH